jgi:Zn-dependent M28 family amino/carboxypeptidase
MRHFAALIALAGALAASAFQPVTPAVRVDAAQVFRDVEVLAADGMQGRLAGSAGGERAREYIRSRLEQAGVTPINGTFAQPFTFTSRGEERHGTNLMGAIRGTRFPDRFIVVTAHYDHVGVRDGQVYNGADDNASGVAGLLAVAAHFAREKPQHSLLIAALDAEEEGLQGAKALLRDPPVPVAAMTIDINMDMIGRDPRNRLFAVGTHYFPFLKPYLEHVAQPPVVLLFGHDTPGAQARATRENEDWTDDSDHYAFHEAGIPWIYFGVEDFDQLHKPTDDSATIDKAFLAGAAATVIAAVRELDENWKPAAR